jgi:hypothetical protein
VVTIPDGLLKVGALESGVWLAPEQAPGSRKRANRTYGDEVLVVLNDTRVNEVLDRLREEDRGVVYDAFEASRAIGIALGLMLRPEAFDMKGGR